MAVKGGRGQWRGSIGRGTVEMPANGQGPEYRQQAGRLFLLDRQRKKVDYLGCASSFRDYDVEIGSLFSNNIQMSFIY